MKTIESSSNQTFKMLKSLSTSKGIKKESKFIVCGQHLLKEVERSGVDFESIHFDEETQPDYLLGKKLFNEVSPIKTEKPLYILKTRPLKAFDFSKAPEGLEVLIPVGDPKNLGALIRTSLAFEVRKIILLEESANPFLPEVVKSSSGAVIKAPLFKGPSIERIVDQSVYSLDKNGTPIDEIDFDKKGLRLLIGEEGGRLPENLKKNLISIPISNQVESLNVNSCLSIALYEILRNN